MESTGYTTLTRQSGLMREMQVIANNIANSATTGFRPGRPGLCRIRASGTDEGPSISMAICRSAQHVDDPRRADENRRGNPGPMAIEGEGFFLIETPLVPASDPGGVTLRCQPRATLVTNMMVPGCWMPAARRSLCRPMRRRWGFRRMARSADGWTSIGADRSGTTRGSRST